jgi:circadian clock protein KaiB
MSEEDKISQQIEEAAARTSKEVVILRLYITGATPKSARAIANIKRICDEYLPGRYQLEVIDLYQHPEATREEDVVVAPTLIKRLPLPLKRLLGDLSNRERVLKGLDIRIEEKPEEQE